MLCCKILQSQMVASCFRDQQQRNLTSPTIHTWVSSSFIRILRLTTVSSFHLPTSFASDTGSSTPLLTSASPSVLDLNSSGPWSQQLGLSERWYSNLSSSNPKSQASWLSLQNWSSNTQFGWTHMWRYSNLDFCLHLISLNRRRTNISSSFRLDTETRFTD